MFLKWWYYDSCGTDSSSNGNFDREEGRERAGVLRHWGTAFGRPTFQGHFAEGHEGG
jgi:hypothetical protein